MKQLTKRQQNAMNKRIERVYYANCSGVQVSVMDIGKIFQAGRQAIQNGADDEGLKDAIVAFVETIRVN